MKGETLQSGDCISKKHLGNFDGKRIADGLVYKIKA